MTCDIIIPIWNQLACTTKCIESIKRNTKISYRLILIDNASDNDTRDYLFGLSKRNEGITLIRNKENLGFVKAVNQGLKASGAPYVCVVNNDTVASEGWLSELMDLARSRPEIGLVTPQSESPGKLTVDEYGRALASNKGQYIETNQCLWFCVLVKREVLEKIGCLDEIYGMGGYDDADFAMRAHKAGYKCVTARGAYVYHKWHTSFKKAGKREELVRKNQKIFFDKWGKYLRIAYPIPGDSKEELSRDMYTSLGLAREWNWIHAWIGSDIKAKKAVDSLRLPAHQNVRRYYLSRKFFFITILFKLVERSLKGKKHFDACLITNRNLFNALSRFRGLFRTPLIYIDKDQFPFDAKNEKTWSERASAITNIIKEEI